MAGTTNLPRNTPPSYYLDGMDLGAGIDAITGESAQNALDFKTKDVSSTGSQDTFFFRALSDVTELESSKAMGFTGSVTFPADGVKVGEKRSFDFANTSKSSASVLIVVFDWERRGNAKCVYDVKLSADARLALANNKAEFRNKYGDYFVYQISYMAKFTAVWKCTSEKSEDMKSFQHEISGSLSAGEMEASGSFTNKMSSVAKKHGISVEVQFQVVGDAGSTSYDHGDIRHTFNSFRDAAKPIPYEVLLRHYNTVDSNISTSINMDTDVFRRVSEAFTTARFVLFLIGVVPGTPSVRIERRNKIDSLFREIHSKRSAFQHDPSTLKSPLQELKDMRDMLWLRLKRQELVMEVRSITYEEMKRKFTIAYEDGHGAWVRCSENVGSYVLGRTGFTPDELKKYAVWKKETVAEVNVTYVLLKSQTGTLEFPGTSGINGYVVGITVRSGWGGNTNGWWCCGRELSLGKKQAKVEVASEGSRGMRWLLDVYYIPSSEYEE